MRALELAKVAAAAEALRIKRFARRQGIRIGLAASAAVFLLALVTMIHVLAVVLLAMAVHLWLAVLIVLVVDLVIGGVLGSLALSDKPDRIELEAAAVRRQSLSEAKVSSHEPCHDRRGCWPGNRNDRSPTRSKQQDRQSLDDRRPCITLRPPSLTVAMDRSPDPVLAQREGRIGRITLNRPRALNALTLEMINAVTVALETWRDDPAIHLIVIDSSSDRAFCAGGDVRSVRDWILADRPTGHRDVLRSRIRPEPQRSLATRSPTYL